MIIDANVAVYWAVPGPHTDHAAQIMNRPDLSAPSIFIVEVASALINHARAGTISHTQIGPMVSVVERSLTLRVDADLVPDALDISLTHNHKIYDCLYLALALQLREPLATADRRLVGLAQDLSIETELIEPAL